MKNMLKYILIGIGVVIVQWLFLALAMAFFSGTSHEGAITIGVGMFLAFVIVICTGIIIDSIKR